MGKFLVKAKVDGEVYTVYDILRVENEVMFFTHHEEKGWIYVFCEDFIPID